MVGQVDFALGDPECLPRDVRGLSALGVIDASRSPAHRADIFSLESHAKRAAPHKGRSRTVEGRNLSPSRVHDHNASSRVRSILSSDFKYESPAGVVDPRRLHPYIARRVRSTATPMVVRPANHP